jgi:predicted nucleic acid-binding protein
MTGDVVVDASAALAILRNEPAGKAVLAELRATGRWRILVPDLFWLEVTNALVRRHAISGPEVVEAIRELDELGVETITLDRPLLLLALERSIALDLTAYDPTYLAIAEVEDAALLSLDARLATAAGLRARPSRETGSTGIAESPAPYGQVGDSPAAWLGYGRLSRGATSSRCVDLVSSEP